MRLALYEPEIPQNTGTLLRTAACLGFEVDIILPCGFPISDRRLRRAGMDYMDHLSYTLHDSYEVFLEKVGGRRLVLLSTKANCSYTAFSYSETDILMVGRESNGVPEGVERKIDARVLIPMKPGLRSLNVAIAAGMVMGEMIRQLTIN